MEISHQTWLKSVVGRDLTEGEARELFMISRRDQHQQGEHLFSEGDEASSLFLLANGTVEITKRTADGQPHSIASHEAGAVLGEMSLLTRENHSASAVVRSDSATILRITWKDLDELLAREPLVAYKFMYALARVLARRLKTINLRLADIAQRTPDHNLHEQIEEFKSFKKKVLSDSNP
jgi:CRP/FNR family transcriptional regulator, cyclic AMP receptor protein